MFLIDITDVPSP